MGILDVVLPAGCAGCGRPGASPCATCVAHIEPAGWVPGLVLPVVAAAAYTGAARELVVGVKYRRRRDALAWMADAVAAAVTWGELSPAVITWLPASQSGRRSRGFDQGRLLAAAVGERLGLSVIEVLTRAGRGRQVGRDRAAREAGAMDITATTLEPDAVGCRILVIDDVVTTGASMTAAHRALHTAGAAAVVGAAFAHKP